MSKTKRNKEITCLKCSDKFIDSRDYVFCMLKSSPANGFGYLGRKKEGYKKTPKWCPKKTAPLLKVLK